MANVTNRIPTTVYNSVANSRNMGTRHGSTTSATLTANKAYFTPFRTDVPITVKQLTVYNGATTSGNIDMGIYTLDGKQLVSSGSIAQAGTSVVQAVDIADTVLAPGCYYIAWAIDNATGTILRQNGTGVTASNRLYGWAVQASAFPLPATATLASCDNFPPILGAVFVGVI